MTTTRNLTILLTDIKGFSDKTSHKSRADIEAMLNEHREIVLPALEDRGGRLLKTIGDAFLMTFDSPTNAVLAGIAVQEALAKRNEGRTGDDRLEVRIAINVGEVNITESDVFGEPVNITARIEGIAEAGEVFFTEAVYLAMNKAEVPSSEVGKFKLKGIEGEFKVYKVRRETPLSGTVVPPQAAVSSAKVIEVGEPAPKAWIVGSRPPEHARPGAHAAPAAPAGPESKEARKARRRVLWRRAGATLIDAILCSMVAGMLAGDDSTTYNVRMKKPKHAPRLRVESVDPSTGTVRVSSEGIHVEGPDGTVNISAKGLHVKDKDVEVKLGVDGLSVREKGGRGSEDDEDEVLADEDDVRVERHTEHKSRKSRIFPFVWLAMNVAALAAWQTTPGKRLLGFKVVRFEDGGTPDWKVYLLRSAMTLVSASPMGLGYAWAYWEKDGRGWHDLLAGTRVVRAEDPARSA